MTVNIHGIHNVVSINRVTFAHKDNDSKLRESIGTADDAHDWKDQHIFEKETHPHIMRK